MIEPGSTFLLIAFYLVCIMAALVSVRLVYKVIWRAASMVLGLTICVFAAIYAWGLIAVLIAL